MTNFKNYRPELHGLDRADFRRLADLAWRLDPLIALPKQMGRALGINERSAQRWLDYESPPPIDIIEKAIALADAKMSANADLIDRVEALLKAHPKA